MCYSQIEMKLLCVWGSSSGTYSIPSVTVELQDSADVVKRLEAAKTGNKTLLDDAFSTKKLSTKTYPGRTVIPIQYGYYSNYKERGRPSPFSIGQDGGN